MQDCVQLIGSFSSPASFIASVEGIRQKYKRRKISIVLKILRSMPHFCTLFIWACFDARFLEECFICIVMKKFPVNMVLCWLENVYMTYQNKFLRQGKTLTLLSMICLYFNSRMIFGLFGFDLNRAR